MVNIGFRIVPKPADRKKIRPVERQLWTNGFRKIMLDFKIRRKLKLAFTKGTFPMCQVPKLPGKNGFGDMRGPIAASGSFDNTEPAHSPTLAHEG